MLKKLIEFIKSGCWHDWSLVNIIFKGSHKREIYKCNKCDKLKKINIDRQK